MPETSKYDYLWPIATPRRREYIEALRKTGDNHSGAEKLLGVSKGLIFREMKRAVKQAEQRGLAPEYGMNSVLPDGFNVERLSTMRRLPNGDPYWEIAKKQKDVVAHTKRLAEDLREQFADAVGLFSLADPAPISPPVSHALVDFEFGDPHFGMYADEGIVGEHFDTDRATALSVAAITKMARQAPPAQIAHFTMIGDNTHASDKTNSTRMSKNPLDVDPRGHSHSLMACAKFCIYSTRLLLEKYEKVVVNILPGNHDEDAAFSLSAIVAMAFEGNPRVECEVSERRIRVFAYDNVGLAYHHGDKIKITEMPRLIATDYRKIWGAVDNWYALSGHIHHEKWIEEMQMLCRSLSTLAGKDRWHSEAGYRALQKTGYTVYDTRYGMDSHHPLGLVRIEEEV